MSYTSTVIADGAVGFWPLNESSGTTATDLTGNANGLYSATGITYSQAGIAGGGAFTACRFTSANSGQVVASSVVANQLADTFTLEIWCKRASIGAYMGLVGADNSANCCAMDFDQVTNGVRIVDAGVAPISVSNVTITDTTSFHHIVWTKSGSANHIYIDGSDATGSVSNQTFGANTSGWVIGADNPNVFYQNGTLQMGAIYPSALTPTQVTNHWQIGSNVQTQLTVPGPPPLLGRMGR